MFESAQLGHKTDKATDDSGVPKLRGDLLNAQFNMAQKWMDPRHIQTHAMGKQSDGERERPAMWRFWRALPPWDKIGVLFGP